MHLKIFTSYYAWTTSFIALSKCCPFSFYFHILMYQQWIIHAHRFRDRKHGVYDNMKEKIFKKKVVWIKLNKVRKFMKICEWCYE